MRRDFRSRTGWRPHEARDPWQIGRCRRGDRIRVFSGKQDAGRTAQKPVTHGIHLIAIGRRRPWLGGRTVDDRTELAKMDTPAKESADGAGIVPDREARAPSSFRRALPRGSCSSRGGDGAGDEP
jgi:hypothetical protein